MAKLVLEKLILCQERALKNIIRV